MWFVWGGRAVVDPCVRMWWCVVCGGGQGGGGSMCGCGVPGTGHWGRRRLSVWGGHFAGGCGRN